MTQIVVSLTPEDARALTDEIRGAADRLWELLFRAWEGKAYRALGYGTWEEYVGAEFDMSRAYSYRLLDQARVVTALKEATGGMSPLGDITEREAREIKPVLKAVTEAVQARVGAGQDPAEAVKVVVNEARAARPAPQGRNGNHTAAAGPAPYNKPASARRALEFVRTVVDAPTLTDEEIAAIPTNEIMLAGLRRARDLTDRIIRRHTKGAKPASN